MAQTCFRPQVSDIEHTVYPRIFEWHLILQSPYIDIWVTMYTQYIHGYLSDIEHTVHPRIFEWHLTESIHRYLSDNVHTVYPWIFEWHCTHSPSMDMWVTLYNVHTVHPWIFEWHCTMYTRSIHGYLSYSVQSPTINVWVTSYRVQTWILSEIVTPGYYLEFNSAFCCRNFSTGNGDTVLYCTLGMIQYFIFYSEYFL